MRNHNFIRISGVAIIIASMAILAASILQDATNIIYAITFFGTMIGFIGIHLYQKESAGVLSLASIVVILLSFFLYGSDSTEPFADMAFLMGFLLLGIASYRANKFPRWTTSVLVLGVILGLIGSLMPSAPNILDTIVTLILTAGFAAIGYSLWNKSVQVQAVT